MIVARLLSPSQGHDLSLAGIVFGERPVSPRNLYPKHIEREGHSTSIRIADDGNPSGDFERARFIEEIHGDNTPRHVAPDSAKTILPAQVNFRQWHETTVSAELSGREV